MSDDTAHPVDVASADGWIEAEWAASENNRRAKYYKLTTAGRKALKTETAQWERLSAAIMLVVRPA